MDVNRQVGLEEEGILCNKLGKAVKKTMGNGGKSSAMPEVGGKQLHMSVKTQKLSTGQFSLGDVKCRLCFCG